MQNWISTGLDKAASKYFTNTDTAKPKSYTFDYQAAGDDAELHNLPQHLMNPDPYMTFSKAQSQKQGNPLVQVLDQSVHEDASLAPSFKAVGKIAASQS